jgi:hypothetical protein
MEGRAAATSRGGLQRAIKLAMFVHAICCVAQDLERQVRLILGLCQTSVENKTEGDDVGAALSRYIQLSKHHQHDDQRANECEFPRHTEQLPVGVRDEVKRDGEFRGKREERKDAVLLKERREKRCKANGLGEKAQLFLHLNKHHGAPLSQLKQLSSSGSYQTRTGAGEEGPPSDIQWPLEACIVLPTPHHLTSSPAAQSSPLLSSSSSQLLHQPPPARPQSTFHTPFQSVPSAVGRQQGGGRLVYTSAQSWADGGEVGEDGQLVFESRFESGNLYQARQTGPHEYMLVLNPDLYSKRHVQWYYFRVSNMETTPIYTFHIVNFEKSKSLYSKGLQPLLYSEQEARTTGVGWRRVGWNVSYTQSRVNYPPHMSPLRSYFTLTWSMRFYHHGDTCYLAHCYPYPLSALYTLLGRIEEDTERAKYIQREELCRTLAGNPCPLLTVTEFTGEGSEEGEGKKKRGVVVTARVHPGETNSSWMMEGLILFLTSDSPQAHALRKSFVFKLVPMLNPDGVVVGNYRTSLAGVDLNRVFRTPVTAAFPTISHTKKMMNSFQQEIEVCVYVDLHGHSRKHNVFMYGCHTPKADHTQFLYERLLPFLLSEQAADMFCLASCKFAVQRCKESTGRVVTWRSGVPNSFTLEATFCGSNLGPNRWQFSDRDLLRMGSNLGEAFYKFSKCLQSKTYQLKVMARLAEKLMKRLATPTDNIHRPTSTLPDVVTSTTTTLSPHSHACLQKKQARQSLSKFKKLDMRQLEEESSTSGSDSENQDFKYKRKKGNKGCDRRQQRSVVGTHTGVHEPFLPSLPRASRSLVLPPAMLTPRNAQLQHLLCLQNPRPELTLPSLLTQATPTQQQTRVSAPARFQSNQSTPKWKFVNRYSNRSNGGIPMFAEERMKERMDKRFMDKSVVHLPVAPSLPNVVVTKQGTKDHTHQNLARQPHPFWTNCTDNISSPRQHYEQIKELVEFGHTHSPLRPLPQSPLSPQLLSYISHLWEQMMR